MSNTETGLRDIPENITVRMSVDQETHARDPRSVAFANAFPLRPLPPMGPVNTDPIATTPSTGHDELWSAIVPETRSRANDLHLPIVAAYAARLCDAYPEADRELVMVATILHDTGWAHVDQSRIVSEGFRGSGDWRQAIIRYEHEVEGMKVARRVLPGLGYEDAFIERVCEIIDGHDTRKVAFSIEDALVRDSDRLWRFDQAGIAMSMEWFGTDVASYMARLELEIIPELISEAGVRMARADMDRNNALLRTEVIR
ncbi:HD domain-containing protein [Arthrobacter sp. 2MCAF14]|uniref:HD domain-containing protein n=1 Tax=Arthrobacter sp. 2MCAF14 TaxID=3232982 RepID=UPI003F938F85